MEVVFCIFIFSEVIIHAKHMLLFNFLYQWFPTFSAPGIGIVKTIFSTSWGWGEWFQDDSSTLHLLRGRQSDRRRSSSGNVSDGDWL